MKKLKWISAVVMLMAFSVEGQWSGSRTQPSSPGRNSSWSINRPIQGAECRETRGGPECHPLPSGRGRQQSSSDEGPKTFNPRTEDSPDTKKPGGAGEIKGFFSVKVLKNGELLLFLYNDIKKEYLDIGDVLIVQGNPQEIFPKYMADAIEAAAPAGSRDSGLYIFSRGGAEFIMRNRMEIGLDPVLGLCDGGSIEVGSTGTAEMPNFGESGNIREQSVMGNIRGQPGKIQGRSGGRSSGGKGSKELDGGGGSEGGAQRSVNSGSGNPFVGGSRSGGDIVGDSFADRFSSGGLQLPSLIISGPCGDGRGDGIAGSCRQGTPLPSMGGGTPDWMARFFHAGESGWAMADDRPASDPALAAKTVSAINTAVSRAEANSQRSPTTTQYAERLRGVANKITNRDIRVYSDDLGVLAGRTGPDSIIIDDDFTTNRATLLHEASHLAGAGEREASAIAREIFASSGGEPLGRERSRQRPGGDDYVDCPPSGCPQVLVVLWIEDMVDWTDDLALQLAQINGPGGADIVDCFGETDCDSSGSGGIQPGVHLTWGMVLHDPLGPYVNPGSEFSSETSAGSTGEGSSIGWGSACQAPFTYVSANRYTIDCMAEIGCQTEEGNQRAMQRLQQQPTKSNRSYDSNQIQRNLRRSR